MNAEKIQLIWLGSSYYTASVSRLPLSVGRSTVFPDDTVLNLGVTFGVQLTTRNHVDNVVRSCFFQLRQLGSVLQSMTDEALHTIVQAFIASRVDYCNALLYGVAFGELIRAYHTDTALHSSLAADITAHHFQNCADNVRLFSRPMSEVL